MNCKCELRPKTYPNCTRLAEAVNRWTAGPGELEIRRHSTLPKSVSLVFRSAQSAERISLWIWAVESRFFKLPSLFNELLKITAHFVMTADQDSDSQKSRPKAPGLSRKRLMVHRSRTRLSDALRELRRSH
jgi:hypothetical protein